MTTRITPSPLRKPIDSLYNVWWGLRNLSQGHERPLRNALYNVVVVAVICAFIAVGVVLEPFLKPLLWAFLFGAVLYPFKRKLSFGLKSWFDDMEKNDTNILIAVAVAPFKGLESLGEFFGTWLRQHVMIIGGLFAALMSFKILISFKSQGIFCLFWRAIVWAHSLFSVSLSNLNLTIVNIPFK